MNEVCKISTACIAIGRGHANASDRYPKTGLQIHERINPLKNHDKSTLLLRPLLKTVSD
jgi:hypothetical protein